MNSDDNIKNGVNENLNNNQTPSIPPYQRVENLNAMPISNTDVNSALESNIQNNQKIVMPEFNNLNGNQNVSNVNNQNIINKMVDNPDNPVLYDTTNTINDKPVQVKKKKASIQINTELKTAIILALILFIFIMIMPSIMDLFY